LKEYIFNKEFQKVISGSAQPQLPIKDLKKFRFIKPLYPEQARLIIIAGSIHNKIEQEYRTLEKLNHLKQGLMQDLLTGRKRVKVENELKNTLESKAIN
jgi:type I restriction enzyme S subunit